MIVRGTIEHISGGEQALTDEPSSIRTMTMGIESAFEEAVITQVTVTECILYIQEPEIPSSVGDIFKSPF